MLIIEIAKCFRINQLQICLYRYIPCLDNVYSSHLCQYRHLYSEGTSCLLPVDVYAKMDH